VEENDGSAWAKIHLAELKVSTNDFESASSLLLSARRIARLESFPEEMVSLVDDRNAKQTTEMSQTQLRRVAHCNLWSNTHSLLVVTMIRLNPTSPEVCMIFVNSPSPPPSPPQWTCFRMLSTR
jgi:hypothetical protein